MLRPPTQWGCATMLKLFTVLCVLMFCHAKPFILRYQRSVNNSTPNHISISKTENAAKRDCEGEQCGHYHRAVPEHFEMAEHGPEIHLDIDECGSRVDTHPAALSVDTSTDPHEHCCHHCYHGCHCCDKRSLDAVEHHHDDYDEHQDPAAEFLPEPAPRLIQHTPDTRQLAGNNDESCMEVGEGGCGSRGEMEQCYGGVCRDHVAHLSTFHPYHPFQYSEHAVRQPLHNVYDAPTNTYHSPSHLVAESPNNAAQRSILAKFFVKDSTHDAHTIGHIAEQTRDTNGIDTPAVIPASDENGSPSNGDGGKLITFGQNSDGIALTDDETTHSPGARGFIQENIALKRSGGFIPENIALKRSGVKNLKRSKRC